MLYNSRGAFGAILDKSQGRRRVPKLSIEKTGRRQLSLLSAKFAANLFEPRTGNL